MRIFHLLPLAAVCALASCISEEPMNTECDIEQVMVHLDDPSGMFYHDYDTLQTVSSTEDSIRFLVRSYARPGKMPLSLRVTDRAVPYLVAEDGSETPHRNGALVDFSGGKSVKVRVVSEDRHWSRLYSISMVNDVPSEGDMLLDFNNYALDASGKYYVWTVTDKNALNGLFGASDPTWKNGNPGYRLSASSAKPMDYPSVPVVGGGPDGSACLKLETKSTGAFGNMVNMRMAAGSMFVGEFDVANALKDALKATRFGRPFKHKPVRFSCWLKFEAGESPYQDRQGKPVEGVVDEPDAYIVVYRNQDEEGHEVQLDGNDVLTSPHIVGVARLPHHYKNPDATLPYNGGGDLESGDPIHGVTGEWREYVMDVQYHKEVDPEILANNGYSMVIGFACSWQGAYFRGSLGTRMYVDNVRVVCEK